MLKKVKAYVKNWENSYGNSDIFLRQVFSCLPQVFNAFLPQAWIKLGASRKKHIISHVKHTFFRLDPTFIKACGKKMSELPIDQFLTQA